MVDDTSPGWQQAVAQLNMRTTTFPPERVLTAPLATPPAREPRRVPRADAQLIKAIAQEFAKQARRIEALEQLLAAKGHAPPGVAIVDPAVVAFVRDYCGPMERRLDKIENDPTLMRDCDVWQPERGYKAGSVVTYRGLMWRARCGTDSKPGGPDWRMLHKHGREP